MSLNQSMNISLGSMRNNQYALTVVAQNIANLNTDGYHRKRVDFQEAPYTSDCNGVISTIRGMNGATIASLTGFVDDAAFIFSLLEFDTDIAKYAAVIANARIRIVNKVIVIVFLSFLSIEKSPPIFIIILSL